MIDKIISQYARSVYHFCKNMTWESAADDLTQEVFIRINRHLDNRNRTTRELNKFVFLTANSVCIDLLRKTRNERQLLRKLKEQPLKSNYTPQDEYIHKEEISKMQEAVKKMPLKLKQIFLLRTHSDIKFTDIADLLDLPLNTVLARMHYSIKYLKKEVKDVQSV